MPAAILAPDQARLEELRAACLPLADRDPSVRALMQDADRRLAVVADMRALYATLRADAARVAPTR